MFLESFSLFLCCVWTNIMFVVVVEAPSSLCCIAFSHSFLLLLPDPIQLASPIPTLTIISSPILIRYLFISFTSVDSALSVAFFILPFSLASWILLCFPVSQSTISLRVIDGCQLNKIYIRARTLFSAWFIFLFSALSLSLSRPFFCFIVVAFILRFTYTHTIVLLFVVVCLWWALKKAIVCVQIQQRLSAVFLSSSFIHASVCECFDWFA